MTSANGRNNKLKRRWERGGGEEKRSKEDTISEKDAHKKGKDGGTDPATGETADGSYLRM